MQTEVVWGFGGGSASHTMKISSSCRAKIGPEGQVLATTWAIFTILKWQRVNFAEQKCHHSPNMEHEGTPLDANFLSFLGKRPSQVWNTPKFNTVRCSHLRTNPGRPSYNDLGHYLLTLDLLLCNDINRCCT